jgi:hypothetical protein
MIWNNIGLGNEISTHFTLVESVGSIVQEMRLVRAPVAARRDEGAHNFMFEDIVVVASCPLFILLCK